MRRSLLAAAAVFVLGLQAIGAQAPSAARTGQRGMALDLRSPDMINWNLIMFPTQRFADRDKEQKDPVKLFDNLYSVGDETVCSFLLTTNAGLVLIDTTFPETVDLVLDNIRKVGFDPANVPQDRFGLEGMRKRAQLCGGRTQIQSAPHQGTTIMVEVPLPEGESPQA